MPAVDLLDRLYCSYCGHQIGNVKVCPHCMEPNDFLDVTPPRSFIEESARAMPLAGTTKVSLRSPASEEAPAVAPAVVPAASPPPQAPQPVPVAARDDDGPTVILRLPDDEDRTVSLQKKKDEPEVFGVLLSQDPGSESIRHELREGTFTVGRKDAQILISRDTVSKKHALIQVEKNGSGSTITVLDRGSENATYVNDVKLKPNERYPLKDQDVVRFADATFRLSVRS